ncbi:alanine--tRNA ligase [archaeon]|jgi:alanyl-tRNA synthetase|nr:alanine--tRNA ligase [archaeon]
MKSTQLKDKYIEFFKSENHKKIKNSSLVPENDSTVLFTTAGMHPLVPYLLGNEHPSGKRLVNYQRCLRTGDIDEVGDDTHLTCFEMLGNWSLGDYWKEEAIKFSFEFLTGKKWLNLPVEKLAVTIFMGDKDSPKDEESSKIWLKQGIDKKKIAYLGKKDNWWGPAGQTGPCGPCSEMFYWISNEPTPERFDPTDTRWVEIWNDVFMQYNKGKNGKYSELKQKNVDTGMGFERVFTILENKKSLFETSLFEPLIKIIKKLSGLELFNDVEEISVKKIADHVRSSTFLMMDGVLPSNTDQGYILRRLIRTAIRHGRQIGISETNFCSEISNVVINTYSKEYPLLKSNKKNILNEFNKEEDKFKDSLENGLKKFNSLIKTNKISGKNAFLLFQSFGFPLEMTIELAEENGISVDTNGFDNELKKHQELSRTATKGKFGSGLADQSEEVTKLHTATHMLHAALREIVDEHIEQKGSNITPDRLRFDFNLDRKLTDEEKKKVENLVNEQIKKGLKIVKREMSVSEAKKSGAMGLFDYDGKVSVYSIGSFSKEICTGPHVENTKELGKFRIVKEKSSSAGVRRIKAVLE